MDNKIQVETPPIINLPRRINRLGTLPYNLWWMWNPEIVRIYTLIDKDLWEKTYHNPLAFLRQVERSRINAVTNNRYYLDVFDKVFSLFDNYMKASKTWFKETYPKLQNSQIAYFSFEFGLHESLPVYAGGLGILSGDHLKEASDLGLPLVGVGFLYTQGYFSQKITEDG